MFIGSALYSRHVWRGIDAATAELSAESAFGTKLLAETRASVWQLESVLRRELLARTQ